MNLKLIQKLCKIMYEIRSEVLTLVAIQIQYTIFFFTHTFCSDTIYLLEIYHGLITYLDTQATDKKFTTRLYNVKLYHVLVFLKSGTIYHSYLLSQNIPLVLKA